MSSKIGFTLGVFFYLALPCIAGDTSLVYTGEVKSAFVVGQSVKLADEYASHDLTLRTGDSFVSIWLALPFTGVALDSRQWNHEFDASCGTSLSHVGLPGKIEVGTYQLAPLNRGDNEFLTASYSLPVGALSFTVQRMEGIGRESFKSGWFLKADYSPSVTRGRFDFSFPLRLTWDRGVAGKDRAFIGRFKPELAFRLSGSTSLYAGWEAHMPLTDRDDRDSQRASRAGMRIKIK